MRFDYLRMISPSKAGDLVSLRSYKAAENMPDASGKLIISKDSMNAIIMTSEHHKKGKEPCGAVADGYTDIIKGQIFWAIVTGAMMLRGDQEELLEGKEKWKRE